ncbi:MAG: Mov34/MPN/PAD-1 family protein, partial [Candidatus Hydrogenedentes bacterium]|nr:Mov34/MPN/PAD-1 family protein [Candidatus Hydrogenedentota bacterium]
MADLYIPKDILNELVAQAKKSAPIEACGILAGRGVRVESFYPMANVDNSPDHFTMEPKEQFAVVKKIREAGQQMLAIYHSHPASPARPSVEDIRLALTPGVVYVLVSLASGNAPVVKGFLIEDGAAMEVPVYLDNQAERLALVLPESVRQDVLEYGPRVDAFLSGETSAVAFRAYRVPMGIYEQRTAGRYMVRVRIAAGVGLPEQLRTVARLSRQYGNGILHVTTRQDIQIHDVAIEDTPGVLEGLLQAGLSSRGGGGNTVRNISASLSGVCPTEKFDVAPYAVALAEYLLQHNSSFYLPRKYKIAFSGCDDDCGQASIA